MHLVNPPATPFVSGHTTAGGSVASTAPPPPASQTDASEQARRMVPKGLPSTAVLSSKSTRSRRVHSWVPLAQDAYMPPPVRALFPRSRDRTCVHRKER